jgi:hypothetical protein
VSTSTIVVSDGTGQLAGDLQTAGRRVVFTPLTPLTPGELVTVRATTELKDTSGAPLRFAHQYQCEVEPAASAEAGAPNDDWQSAEPLSTPVFRRSGTLTGADNVDYYALTAPAGARLMATVLAMRDAAPACTAPGTPAPAGVLDAELTLLASDGASILDQATGSFTSCAGIDPSHPLDPYLDYTFVAGGACFLRVRRETSEGGSYELEGALR